MLDIEISGGITYVNVQNRKLQDAEAPEDLGNDGATIFQITSLSQNDEEKQKNLPI